MKEQTGMLILMLAQILFGTSAIAYKLLATSIPGNLVVAIRYGIGSIVLLLWLLARGGFAFKKQALTWKTITAVGFLGILGLGISSAWYVSAVRNIGVVLTTLLADLEIPLGVLLGALFLGEKITSRYLQIFAVMGVGFILLTVKNGIIIPEGGSYAVGILGALSAAVVWGACTIIGKKLVTTWRPTQVVFVRLFLASMTNVVILLSNKVPIVEQVAQISQQDWIVLLFQGIVVSGLGFVLFYKSLAILSVKKASLLFLVAPVVSVTLGFVSGEYPLWSQWIGIALIFGGLFFMFRTKDAI